MPESLSIQDARALLIAYQLECSDIAGTISRLATIQYDPLKPLGRNPDLMLQARVPGYSVDDWQVAAYHQRLLYDAWDKQQCLVPVADWPKRALTRSRYQPWHDRSVLTDHADVVTNALSEIDARGPLCSLDFLDRRQARGGHSWYGSSLIKRVLRALWARGDLVTHHREAGRHYYDRTERVIPEEYALAAPLTDEDAYHRWIVQRRHQAVGLLRPTANAEIWCACGPATERSRAIRDLLETGVLHRVEVGPKRTPFHITSSALPYLGRPVPMDRMTFLAPLDNLLWDRKAIEYLFDFKYAWEVYKPPATRTWGYYVLPVLYGDRFVGRFDARLSDSAWCIAQWWWEDGVQLDPDLIAALRVAARQFVRYLGVERIQIGDQVDSSTRRILSTI